MINIYNPDNTNYGNNGDMILTPSKCEVSAAINGTWGLELTHIIDTDGRWKYIVPNAVLKVPSFNGSQLFRIVSTDKSDAGITATADPIFYDCAQNVFILDKRPTATTCQKALDWLTEGTQYSGQSDLTTTATAYYINMNLMECLTNQENGILTRWGGEMMFNNFTVLVNSQIGENHGVTVLYGKNIATNGITESVNMDNVVTRIVPKAYDGYMLDGATPWVDSPLIENYPIIRTKVIEYTNLRLKGTEDSTEDANATYFNTLAELRAAMIKAAENEFIEGIDKPAINLQVDMVLLENTEEYKDFAGLVSVSLGDVILCRHSRLNIDQTARVIALTYDCINESVTAVEIGEAIPNFFNSVSNTIQAANKAITSGGEVIAQQIQGVINGAKAQLKLQSTTAEPQNVKAIIFEDLDLNSSSYGAMALGTKGFMISNIRNATNTDWEWSTFGTGAGFSADLITAGTLQAINILGSTIEGGIIKGATVEGSDIILGSEGHLASTYTNSNNHTLITDISAGKIYQSDTNNSDGTLGYTDMSGANIAASYTYSGEGINAYSANVSLMAGNGTNANALRLSINQGTLLSLDNYFYVYADGHSMASMPHSAPIYRYGPIAGDSSIPSVSLASGTAWTNLGAITLPAGIFLLSVAVQFAANATGRRGIALSTSSGGSTYAILTTDQQNAVNGAVTICRFVSTVEGGRTWYINGYQNSGSALTTYVRYCAPRLGTSSISL